MVRPYRSRSSSSSVRKRSRSARIRRRSRSQKARRPVRPRPRSDRNERWRSRVGGRDRGRPAPPGKGGPPGGPELRVRNSSRMACTSEPRSRGDSSQTSSGSSRDLHPKDVVHQVVEGRVAQRSRRVADTTASSPTRARHGKAAEVPVEAREGGARAGERAVEAAARAGSACAERGRGDVAAPPGVVEQRRNRCSCSVAGNGTRRCRPRTTEPARNHSRRDGADRRRRGRVPVSASTVSRRNRDGMRSVVRRRSPLG